MFLPPAMDRYKENAVPLTLFLITAVAILMFPQSLWGIWGQLPWSPS